MAKVFDILKRIHFLKKKYYKASMKKGALLELLSDSEVAEQVYNSNAIENSTLSLEETENILSQIALERYASERELFEAKNLARVISYINTKAKEKELDIETILLLHKMLISNIRDDIAGRFRKKNEWVRVGDYIAIDPKHILAKLREALIQYHVSDNQNIIKRISLFHLHFEHIHPFVDGNGRIGRVLNNYLLIRSGYVPINIKFVDRKLYYDAFREFDREDKTKIMEKIIGLALANSYHKRLAYLAGNEIITLSEFSKRNKQSHSNMLNKANRQTIAAFTEKGIWKIGWKGKL